MAYKSKYTDIDLSKYDNGFQGTDAIKTAAQKKADADANYNNLGDFTFSKADDYKTAYDNYMNRGKFSYDLNADALYQQYKDNYITQGKMAMMDTMGQAAAMTGGYGNSYAATVGNQVYQAKMSELNNIVPELYQMALERYNSEGEELRDKYNLLANEEQTEYGRYIDNKDALRADRDYYSTDYYNIYNRDFNTWDSDRTYDTNQFWNEHNAGYTAEQDAIANDLTERQVAVSEDSQKLSREQWDYQKSNPTTTTTTTTTQKGGTTEGATEEAKAIPQEVIAQMKKYAVDPENASEYINEQVMMGNISEDQATELYEKYVGSGTVNVSNWTVVDDGGKNWGKGIDKNAKVSFGGNTYNGKQLKTYAKENLGMTDGEAENWVISVQKRLGING